MYTLVIKKLNLQVLYQKRFPNVKAGSYKYFAAVRSAQATWFFMRGPARSRSYFHAARKWNC